MAEQTIFVNNTDLLQISDNNYTNTIIQSLVGPEGKTGPEGPPGPAGPRGPRGRAAPFFPRTVYASYTLALSSGNNIIPVINASWIKVSADTNTSLIIGISSGADGELRILTNTGSNSITIKHNSNDASVDSKILVFNSQDIVLNSNNSANILYDQTAQKWRVISTGIGA